MILYINTYGYSYSYSYMSICVYAFMPIQCIYVCIYNIHISIREHAYIQCNNNIYLYEYTIDIKTNFLYIDGIYARCRTHLYYI